MAASPLAAKRAAAAAADGDRAAVLTDAHRNRLSECDWLRAELRSEPSLRALLASIERAADPAAALGDARTKDDRFAAFVDAVLLEVGIAAAGKGEDGGVAFLGAAEPLPPPDTGKPPRPLYHGGA